MWEHLNGKTLTDRGRQLERSRKNREAADEEAVSERSDPDEQRERRGQQELSAFIRR